MAKRTKAEVRKAVYKAYKDNGFSAACDVFNAPANYKLGSYRYCNACNTNVPSINNECLICDQKTQKTEKL